MFTLPSSRNGTTCDGANRRDFLKVGVLGLGGLALPDLLRLRAADTSRGKTTKNTSVVWLWLGGGPTHVETFDPKMTAPVEFRSAVGAIKTNVTGIELGGVFPQMAKHADKMAFVRSFAHRNSGHGGGTHWVMTGYDYPPADNNQAAIRPAMGSILSRERGATSKSGLPTYVRLNGIYGDGPVWLGSAYAPFDVGGNAQRNMAPTIRSDRLDDRRSLLKTFDNMNRAIDKSGLVAGLDSFETQAFDLLKSRAREVFDLNREDPRLRDRYGKSELGRQMLMARRLCEAGVGFVTIHHGGWDMHGQIAQSMRNLAPQVDQAVSAFLDDLAARGLEDEILLVITGEFGRTPRINGGAGRDHWAPLSTLALAGGGLKMGQVVGQSSEKAEVPKSTPITPQDLMATVFHVLGLPQDLHYKDPSGRPTPMITGGKVIGELV
jgi:hypothetical protein